MLGYFDYTALRGKKQQEVKKGSLSFQVFFPNFLLFTEKIYAQIEKKSMLSRSVNVSVTMQASRPTIVSPSLWPIKVHGNNRENIPPQSVRSKAKLGHLLTHPHFKSAQRSKEIIAYCEHTVGCWVNNQKMNVKSSGQPAYFIDGNSQISKMVVDLPGWKLLTGPECASSSLQQFGHTHSCCSVSLFCIPLTVSYKSIISFGPSHLLEPCLPVSPTETLLFPCCFLTHGWGMTSMTFRYLPWQMPRLSLKVNAHTHTIRMMLM